MEQGSGRAVGRGTSHGEEASRSADQAPEMIEMMGGRLEVIARLGTRSAHDGLVRRPGSWSPTVASPRYFGEAGRPASASDDPLLPSLEQIQRMDRVSQAYGYWITSRAENKP